MKIIEKTQDPGGSWMVKVMITSTCINYFTFTHNPVDVEVELVVYKFCMAMNDDEFNAIKPTFLKMVENEYFNFIKNEWNVCLKSHGIIPPDYEITIQNTDEAKNIYYLLVLKAMSKQEYYNMSGEFDRYKRLISDNGGIMSRVKFHTNI